MLYYYPLTVSFSKSLELFCPPSVQSKVIDVATNLSTARGMESSQVVVRGLISSSTKIVLKELENKTKTPKLKKDEIKSPIDHAIEAATSSIRSLLNDFSKVTYKQNFSK